MPEEAPVIQTTWPENFMPMSATINAAVDVERGAGCETVELTREKHRGARNVVGVAGAPQRNLGHSGADRRGWRVQLVKLRAKDKAGSESIDADALRAEFDGEGAGEREHGALRGRVGERAGAAALAPGDRREVHDARAAAGLRGSGEVRREHQIGRAH